MQVNTSNIADMIYQNILGRFGAHWARIKKKSFEFFFWGCWPAVGRLPRGDKRVSAETAKPSYFAYSIRTDRT